MSATPLHRKALLAGGEHAATQACAGIEPQLPPASPGPTVAVASPSPGSSARCTALIDVQLSPSPSVELENHDSPPPAWEARPSSTPPTVPVPERGPPDDGQCAHLPCRSPTSSAVTELWILALSTIFDLSALKTRAEAMLLGEGERPAASRIDAVAEEATLGLVLAVRGVVAKLWADRQDDIKPSCAPALIDEVDVIAYVIADALGRPVLHPDDTNGVGKRVDSCAKRVRSSKVPDARREARKAAAKAGAAAQEAEAAEAEAKVLRTAYPGLSLPARTVGKKRKAEREPTLVEQRDAAACRVMDAARRAEVANQGRKAALEATNASCAAWGAALDAERSTQQHRQRTERAVADVTRLSGEYEAALDELKAAQLTLNEANIRVGLAAYWGGLDVVFVEKAPGCRVMLSEREDLIEDFTADDVKKLCGCGDQVCMTCNLIGLLP
jgi:hypothetical protein